MGIIFNGSPIYGTQENPAIGDWDLNEQFSRVFGLDGSTILYGGKTLRPIEYRIVIHNSFISLASLNLYLGSVDALIGQVGDLYDSFLNVTLPNIYFRGYAQEEGPIPPNPHLGWLSIGKLRFVQMGPATT